MKQTLMMLLLFVLISVSMLFGDAVKPAGSGTEADPYQIATLENLSWFAQGDSSAWVSFYIQTADINASGTQYWDDSDDNEDGDKYNDPNDLTSDGTNDGFFPIGGQLGDSWVRFKNTYDGQGNLIDSLFINRPNMTRVAFFGYAGDAVDKATKIINLGLTNVNIIGKDNVAGLVGKFRQGDEINNCYCSGNVSGVNLVGGLVGECRENSSIIKSYSAATVTSSGLKSGGLVGYFYGGSGIISECYAVGNVSGEEIGGFAGRMYKGKVENCYASGTVTPVNGSVAYASFCNEVSEKSNIENCYTFGNVGNSSDGHGFVRVCYNGASTFANNFFDTEATQQSEAGSSTGGADASAVGRTTVEMKTDTTYTNHGWDFTDVWEIVGDNYPSFKVIATDIASKSFTMPQNYSLHQNYPNPFNPITTISYELPVQSSVEISVYNVLGQKMAVLIDKEQDAGMHKIGFNASSLSSGIYFYSIKANNFISVKKMLLTK